VNKPMTVQFRAASTQHIGWMKLTINAIAGFLVLWLLIAMTVNRRSSNATA